MDYVALIPYESIEREVIQKRGRNKNCGSYTISQLVSVTTEF
jgi:hypothetical protein